MVQGYDKIKEDIAGFALTESGRIKAREMQPSINMQQITSWQEEVSEAIEILKLRRYKDVSAMAKLMIMQQGNY